MKLNLQNKLLLPIIGTVAVIMLSSAYITNVLVEKQLLANYNEELAVISNTLAKNVSSSAAGYKRDLVSLAATARLRAYVTAVVEKDAAAVERTRPVAEQTLEDYKVFYKYFPVMSIAGPDGLVFMSTDRDSIGKVNIGKRDYFEKALRGEVNISEPLMSMSTQGKSVVVAVPVMAAGKPRAVLYAILSCKDIAAATIDGITVGSTGFAFLVDSRGLMLAHPDEKLVQAFDARTADWGRQVLAATSGTLSYFTRTGVKRHMAYRLDKESGWYSVISIDASEIDQVTVFLRNVSFGATAAGLVLMALVVFLIVRPIIRDLLSGVNFATAVADGDLDRNFTAQRGDELGTLFDALRSMVANLKSNIEKARQESENAREQSAKAVEAMKHAEAAGAEAQGKTTAMLAAADKLEAVANVVSSASAQLSAQIEQSERGAAEQATRVAETATAMEEMNSTVLEVARNAGQASEVSATTRTKAEAGAGVVQKAVQSIQEVQRQSLLLKEDMVTLGENAQSINQIMGVISDIADQTNLLALNAAIEAARAGDAGRGFAVVADEVRKLAEKTMTSTTDVGNAIKAIQASAGKSMTQVDSAVKTIEQATEYANQSGAALGEIVTMVDSAADQVRAIATASEQQSASSEEINQSITQVNTIATETARAMQEAAQAVSDLANQAQVLSRLIEDMKKG